MLLKTILKRNDTIKEKDNEISFLKSKIKNIQNTLEYWKDKFKKLISFLYDKLHSWYDKDVKTINILMLLMKCMMIIF